MNEGSPAVKLPGAITAEDYLGGETGSEERHEFRDGIVTAMRGF